MSPLLFAYGTLTPRDREPADPGRWKPDAVRGRLSDPRGFPVPLGLDDPSDGWAEGFVRLLDLDKRRTRLDPREEVESGLYRRTRTVAWAGFLLWVYVDNRPVRSDARGPLRRWRGRRQAPNRVAPWDEPRGASEDRSARAPRPFDSKEMHDGEHFPAGCPA